MKTLKVALFSISLLGFPLFSIFIVPKYPFVEKFLYDQGKIFIKSNQVEEGLNTLEYQNGELYTYNLGKLLRFEKLNFRILPLPELNLLCPSKGFLDAEVFPNKVLKIKIKNFDCSYYAKTFNGNLKIENQNLYGFLEGYEVKIPNLGTLEKVYFTFNGEKVEGYILYGKQKLTGSGIFKLNLQNPSKSYLNLTFRGKGLKIHIEGYLENPKITF